MNPPQIPSPPLTDEQRRKLVAEIMAHVQEGLAHIKSLLEKRDAAAAKEKAKSK